MMIEVSRPPEYARTTFSSMSAPHGEAAHAAAQKKKQNGFLHVHPVLRLVEHDGPRRIDDSIGDFQPAVGGKTMHEHCVRRGQRHQLLVDLIRRETPGALFFLLLLSHARPRVGVNRVHSGNSLVWIMEQVDGGSSFGGNFASIGKQVSIGLIAVWSGNADGRAECRAGKQKRV